MTDKVTQGFVAGIASTILTHPLDTIKIYQQVTSRSLNGGMIKSIKTISDQGWLKGFYRGGLVNCMSMGVFYGCFFPTYDLLKRQIDPLVGQNTISGRFWCGYLSGLWGSFVGNPLYVLKIRQQSSLVKVNCNGQLIANTSASSAPTLIQKIYGERGIRGFWSGYSLTIFRNLELGLQLPLYEMFKDYNIPPMYAGFMSKLISSSITYPFDTCRTLIRNGDRSKLRILCNNLYQTEGVRGFYRGYLLYAGRSVPASAITFTIYELFRMIDAEGNKTISERV